MVFPSVFVWRKFLLGVCWYRSKIRGEFPFFFSRFFFIFLRKQIVNCKKNPVFTTALSFTMCTCDIKFFVKFFFQCISTHLFSCCSNISLYAVIYGWNMFYIKKLKKTIKNKVQSGIWPHFLCVSIFLCWLELELSFLYEAKNKNV